MCLLSMLFTRQSGNSTTSTIEWKEHDILKDYLQESHSLLFIEINRILRQSTCCIDILKISLCLLDILYSTFDQPDSFEEMIVSLLKEYCYSFSITLSTIDFNQNLYSVMSTTLLTFIRKMNNHMTVSRTFSNPFVLNKNSFINTIWRVQSDKKIINSLRLGDEEEMGVYNLKHDVMIAEIPIILGKFIHSHFMVLFIFCHIHF